MTKRLQRIVVLQADGTYTVMAGQRTIKGGFGSLIEADEFVRTEPSRRASVRKRTLSAPKNMQLTDHRHAARRLR